MTDAVITEHAGSRQGTVVRYYQYGSGGVRVLDGGKVTRRLYLFDPSSDMMTERDPSRQEKILRRFVFDPYGMLEETFFFGQRPRTFRYEAGGQQIAVREGGDYGAVGKLFTFEGNGVSETGWGRNGEIERVYVFESGDDAITERSGGWYGNADRTIVFEGIRASVFREPEAFLQFLIFTEWSASDREKTINDQVAKIRGGEKGVPGQSPYKYTGERHRPADTGGRTGSDPGPRTPARASGHRPDDSGIDFIPDADAPASMVTRGLPPLTRRSSEISFEERGQHDRDNSERFTAGRSAEIPLEERFAGAREKEQLSRGRSVEIPLEERFESARREREKLSKGKSAEIPYSERQSGGDR
jgi:hypothetical protein